MPLRAEVTDRLQTPGSCDGLLYAPLARPLTHERSRCYVIDHHGDAGALADFVREVLVDPTSQELHLDAPPARPGAALILDYGMKPGALDLEKEAILRYYRESGPRGFTIEGLSILQRIYVHAPDGQPVEAEPFVRDVCNPAIHTWQLTHVGS